MIVNKKIEYISNLKAVAILMVVFLHSVSPLFYQFGKIDMDRWYITVFYDSFVRCCVPLFLMVNGAVILNKDYKIRDWISNKIIKRLFLPFLFYATLVLLVNKLPLVFVFDLVKIGYWFPFFGIILSLYLLYPIIRLFIKNASINLIFYLVIIWLITIFIGFYFPNFNWFSKNIIYSYVGYPIIGYLFSKYKNINFNITTMMLYIISGLLIFGLTVFSSFKLGVETEKYFDYLSPLVILMSISLFVFIKNIKFVLKNKIIISVRNFLSDHSYGIYFLHPLIISRFYYLHNVFHPVFSDWIIFGSGIVITSLIIYFISKIPIVKNLVG